MTVALAIAAGVLLGLSLGALGAGGSILAVPVLIHLLGQSPFQATTGSLAVVGVTALVGAVAAHRAGTVMLARGVAFGTVAVGGAVVGARAAAHLDEDLLLAAFALLMLVVAATMAWRLLRPGAAGEAGATDFAEPIIAIHPKLLCRCPRALKVLVTATAVGLLTGFLGVGGGFVVVPALLLALSLPARYAAGTSLVVITITSAAALATRATAPITPDWHLVAALAVPAALAGIAGVALAQRIDPRRLAAAFTVVVAAVAVFTATTALPPLL